MTPQRSQTKDVSIAWTLDGRGSTPLQWIEDKTCYISVTCCFLWVGRCPFAMTPHPKETSWACTRLVRPLPPSPGSGSLVDFERSLEQQLRKELNVKARNVCTVRKTWLISRGITVISDLINSVKLLDMNYFKLHFQLHKCYVLSPFGILYSWICSISLGLWRLISISSIVKMRQVGGWIVNENCCQ